MVGRASVAVAGLAGPLLLLLCLLGLPGAEAPSQSHTPRCHAYSDVLLPMEEAERRLAWHCREGWEDGRAVTWLRFDALDQADRASLFTSRVTRFTSLTVAALDTDGAVRTRSYREGEATPLLAGPVFGVALPAVTPETRAILVRIERPHSVTIASEAALRAEVGAGLSPYSLVLLSLVAGMLVMPLFFDLMFYLVLRERFVLLHAGMILSMLVYVLSAGGIITAFITLPVPLLAVAAPLGFAIGAGLAGFFITAFLEPDMLPRGMRSLVNVAAALAALVAGLCALQFDLTQGFDNAAYFFCFVPLLPIYVAAITTALWRGSRAARYLGFAFVPIFATGAERLLRGLGLYAAPTSIDHALFFALGLEVLIITLGVADRFLSLRRERDQAVVRANTLKQLSERDALTGLLNRRAIEDRYVMLRQEGFTTFALLDLDNFKQINDTLGHGTGDEVLKVVGRVLQPGDPNMMTFRLGGEEFLLLVRGREAVARADRARQEIARAVAREDLGCLVTASMGLVQVTGGAFPGATFAGIYARADALLYEAKNAGRNRMVSERIKVFRPRKGERRAAA